MERTSLPLISYEHDKQDPLGMKESVFIRNERVCFPNTPNVSMTTRANRYIFGSIFANLPDFLLSDWSATAPAYCDATLL